MSEIRMKEDVSLAITARHMYHHYSVGIKYSVENKLQEIEVRPNTKTLQLKDEILNDYIPEANKIINRLKVVGESGSLDGSDMTVMSFFKRIDFEYFEVMRKIYNNSKKFEKSELNLQVDADGVDKLNDYIDALRKFASQSLEAEMNQSLSKRDKRLQDLANNTTAISKWADALRTDWSWKNLFVEYGEGVAKRNATVFYSSGGVTESDEYWDDVDKTITSTVDEIIGEGYGVINDKVENNGGHEILKATFTRMVETTGFNKLEAPTEAVYEEIESDY